MALRLNGATSGFVELNAPDEAGSNTLTLPDGNGTNGQYLQTNGSGGLSWATLPAGGKILQVVQTVKTDPTSTTSTSYTDITGMSVTITPSSSSNKILIIPDLALSGPVGDIGYAQLLRGSTVIYGGDSATHNGLYGCYSGAAADGPFVYGVNIVTRMFLDSPATTSATTYKCQFKTNSGTFYLNRTNATSGNYDIRTASSITAIEVAA
jgi:hypothetical protein